MKKSFLKVLENFLLASYESKAYTKAAMAKIITLKTSDYMKVEIPEGTATLRVINNGDEKVLLTIDTKCRPTSIFLMCSFDKDFELMQMNGSPEDIIVMKELLDIERKTK